MTGEDRRVEGSSLATFAHEPGPADDEFIGLVRDRLAAGVLESGPVGISSRKQIVDLALAAKRWLGELEHPGWAVVFCADSLIAGNVDV